MDTFKEELYENTMLDSEKNYAKYSNINRDFEKKLADIQLIDNPDIRARVLVNLHREYINGFLRANESGDEALIDTYKDILVRLGADDYILDDYSVSNSGRQR